MTRRKRTPSPSPPRKRVAFEIPDSLQQLSALSRTLAQQADSLAGVDQDEENGRIIVQAQALIQTPLPPAEQLQSRFQLEKPRTVSFQKFVAQKQRFPEAQKWVQTQRPQKPSRPIPPASTPDSRSAVPATSALGPPFPPPLTPIPQMIAPARASNEPTAKQGEPLCLSTQPQQIAALIAKKLAENEATRRREKWAKEQSAHRISQAADDQLMKELRHELNQHSATTARSQTRNTAQFVQDGIVQLKDYVNSTEVVRTDETTEDVTSAPIQRSQDHDSLFSSTATSPVIDVENNNHSSSNPGSGPQTRAAGEFQSGGPSAQIVTAGDSSIPVSRRQQAQPQAQPQRSKPIQYPRTTSSLRQPLPQQQQQQPARQFHPYPQTNLLPTGPGYYKINPDLWNDAAEVLNPLQQLSYSSSVAKNGSSYTSSNVRQDRFGRYHGNL